MMSYEPVIYDVEWIVHLCKMTDLPNRYLQTTIYISHNDSIDLFKYHMHHADNETLAGKSICL